MAVVDPWDGRSVTVGARAEQCVICGGTLTFWAVVKGYRIERCSRCAHALVNPRPTPAELRQYYEKTDSNAGAAQIIVEQMWERELIFPNSTVDAKRIIARISRLVPRRGRFLDIGCGYGFFSRRARDEGFQVEALEIAPFERDCAARISGITPLAVTFEEFESNGDTYDAILMSQVLEHAADVNQWLRKASHLLRSGGVVAIAVPNFGGMMRRTLGRRDPYINPPAHLNYFTQKSLSILLQKYQLRVEQIGTVSRIPFDALSKRVPHPQAVSRALGEFMSKAQIPPIRLLDALNIGMFLNAYGIRDS